MYTYPHDELQVEQVLVSILGSFWDMLYAGRDQVASVASARGQAEQQTESDLVEAASSVGIATCPVYHRALWYPLTITQSARLPGTLLTYGEGAVYGPQPSNGIVYQYGVSPDTTSSYECPASLAATSLICDHINHPAISLINMVDFQLDRTRSVIIFRNDPFEEFVSQAVLDDDGNETDREITLWLYQADFDVARLYRQFGYVLGLDMPSSPGYADMLRASWDAVVGCTARQQIEDVLSAMTGSPLAKEDGEIVEDVATDAVQLLIITDKNVYRYAATATALVEPGDTLAAGQALTDVFKLYDLNLGEVPPVVAIGLNRSYFDPSIESDLLFVNRDVPLEVSTAEDGHTVARFQISGETADVEQFWALMDARGVASGNTLARLLDQRTNKVG